MAISYPKTVVHYSGTNKGPIYLKDVGQRNGLGGGRGIYIRGQDRYVDPGTDTTLYSSGEVMLSTTAGVIKKMTDAGSFVVETISD